MLKLNVYFKGELMKKVAIVTDSNSGITQEEAQALGVFVVPMPFVIGDEEFFEGITLTQDEFYKKLEQGQDISTSQPAIGSVIELWAKLLTEFEEIVHIPMSSALSRSCETAENFAKDFEGRVFVVDNRRISVTQKQSVYDAIELANRGKSAQEIRDYLVETAGDSSIYIMVDTLKYLRKGGRITPAAAIIGTLLNIKPVLQIQGGKLDRFAKVVNIKQAKQKIIAALRSDIETRFADLYKNGELELSVAHTNAPENAKIFAEELKSEFNLPVRFVDPLSLSVSCHIGSGSLAAVVCRVVKP